MKCHKLLLALYAIASFVNVDAQEFLWPMAGKNAGENILYKPQSYIDKELNSDNLFIGGEEGDAVICPVDGVVYDIGTHYLQDLMYSYGFGYDNTKTLDENIATTGLEDGIERKDISIAICIRTADYRKLHIEGLKGNTRFKTGQKVAAGDTL